MKEAILISEGDYAYKNIGDYAQSIAGKVFFSSTCLNIERETIDEFSSDEPVKCILNGWYMEHPEHWPPSKNIVPLLISMHINKTKAEEFFANGGEEYLKKHGPVGCRDIATKKLLEERGIPSYYSSCLTLVLGEQYKRNSVDKRKIVFVDAYCNPYRNENGNFSIGKAILSAIKFIENFSISNKVLKRYQYSEINKSKISGFIKAVMYVGRFVDAYKSMFSTDIMENAIYISHAVSKKQNNTPNFMYKVMDTYLKEYTSAALVVTSRLHCALPCLGIGTPVLFVQSKVTTTTNEKLAPLSTGRFDGIFEFLNCLLYKDDRVRCGLDYKIPFIDYEKIIDIKNKTKHLKYQNLLIEKCKKFADKK